ncbi:MAG: FecR family protein [Leptospirales bacterium]|nr:FecR family protein [Leptospirales bacterium]
MRLLKIFITTSFLFIATFLYADITVLKVEGSAAYKDGNKWVPLKVNQKLSEGVKISTGANSFVDIKLNSKNHTVQIKPYSMIQIFTNETQTDTNTNIGLKRGSINAKVPRNENVKTVFKVTSPIATSSVRGTEQNVSYGPNRGMVIQVVNGEVEGRNHNGRTNLLTGRQTFVQTNTSGQPQNILQDVRDNSIIQAGGHGITDEESASMAYSDEQIGNPNGDTSVLDNQAQTTSIILDVDFDKNKK